VSKNYIISVFNVKGGVGKTVIAYSLAREFSTLLASNEHSIFTEFYNEAMRIAEADKLPIVKNTPIIYDFGGFIEQGIIRILQESNVIIIPVYYDFEALKKTLETIKAIEKYNKNIIVVATRIEGKQHKKIREAFEPYCSYRIIPLRKTNLFLEMTSTGQPLKQIVKKDKFTKKAYDGILSDWKEFIKAIKEYL